MIATIVKKFIIRGFLLLLVALIAVVLVFMYIQYELLKPTPAPTESELPANTGLSEVPAPTDVEESESVVVREEITDAPIADKVTPEEPVAIPAAPIAVSSLPLTDGQRTLLESFGLNPDEMEITPAMIACALETLGEERYQAIIDGAAPTFFESASLLGCLDA